MKLRNKGTGEIGYLYANKDVNYQVLDENGCVLGVYDTLPRLIEEWEDYKLNIWYNSTISGRYTIEIDFATDKEAEKAVEKLKAWKWLKDKGFRFIDWELDMKTVADGKIWFDLGGAVDAETALEDKSVKASMVLLFGGEE